MIFPVSYSNGLYTLANFTNLDFIINRKKYVKTISQENFQLLYNSSDALQRKIFDNFLIRLRNNEYVHAQVNLGSYANRVMWVGFDGAFRTTEEQIKSRKLYSTLKKNLEENQKQLPAPFNLVGRKITGFSNVYGNERVLVHDATGRYVRYECQHNLPIPNARYYSVRISLQKAVLLMELGTDLYIVPYIHKSEFNGPSNIVVAENLRVFDIRANEEEPPEMVKILSKDLLTPATTLESLEMFNQFYLQTPLNLGFELVFFNMIDFYTSVCSILKKRYHVYDNELVDFTFEEAVTLATGKNPNWRSRSEREKQAAAAKAAKLQKEKEDTAAKMAATRATYAALAKARVSRMAEEEQRRAEEAATRERVEQEKARKTQAIAQKAQDKVNHKLAPGSAYSVIYSPEAKQYMLCRKSAQSSLSAVPYDPEKQISEHILAYLRNSQIYPFDYLAGVKSIEYHPDRMKEGALVHSDEILYLPDLDKIKDYDFHDTAAVVKVLLPPTQVKLIERFLYPNVNLGTRHVMFILPYALWSQPEHREAFASVINRYCLKYLTAPFVVRPACTICIDFSPKFSLHGLDHRRQYDMRYCIALPINRSLGGIKAIPASKAVSKLARRMVNTMTYLSLYYVVLKPYLIARTRIKVYLAPTRYMVLSGSEISQRVAFSCSTQMRPYGEDSSHKFALCTSVSLPIPSDTRAWLQIYLKQIEHSKDISDKQSLSDLTRKVIEFLRFKFDRVNILPLPTEKLEETSNKFVFTVVTPPPVDKSKFCQLLSEFYNYFENDGGLVDVLLEICGAHPDKLAEAQQAS